MSRCTCDRENHRDGCPAHPDNLPPLPSLTDFLLARIAEDEENAQRKAGTLLALNSPERPVQLVDSPFSPTRVLAECEAKRRIVEWYGSNGGADAAACWFLALPYADHDDYREEWKP